MFIMIDIFFKGRPYVLPRRPADRGGHVQQRGGRSGLQRVPRPHRPEGQTEGIPKVQGWTVQQE